MIRLRTFGTVALERDGTPLTGRNTQRRRLALLVVLASARRRPVSRDRILALLWPERDIERGRHALAQLVYELRRDLGAVVVSGSADELAIDEAHLTSDVGDFEAALEQGAPDRAASLYESSFLDGFFVSDAPEFERWVEERRQELAAKYLHVLETLAIAATDAGDLDRAADYRRRAAALDPLSARLALALMQALARAGDRPAAIRHAHLHAQMLRCELEAPPDADVMSFAAELGRQNSIELGPGRAPLVESSTPLPADEIVHRRDRAAPANAAVRSKRVELRIRRYVGRPAALAISAAALLITAAAVVRSREGAWTGDRSQPHLLVLGEVASPDSVLSLAAREAMRAELERTPDVVVLGDAAVASTLRLMRISPIAPLTEALADDVALRTGASAVVTGRVLTIGPRDEVVMRAVDPRSATTIAAISALPRTSGDIVPAITRLVDELHARLNHTAIREPAPLPAVTTASVEALKDYALARAALARIDRQAAITFGEAAVAQDSDFALAHYLLGDLLWYVDQERHAELHLTRAYTLSVHLPLRERLLVRARHAQLVLDRPDSALVFWRALRAAYPNEPLGYEGAVWSDLAIGAYADAAAAADTALQLDSTAAPQVRNRMMALLGLGDTARALALTRTAGARWPYLEQQVRVAEYVMRRDWGGLTRVIDSMAPPFLNGHPNPEMAPTRQALLLTLGRLRDAEAYANVIVGSMHAQFAIRAELFQARGELALGTRVRARAWLRAAVARLDSTDLSAPATARLAEMAAGVAASAGDQESLAALRRIITSRDAGRLLPSHRLAMLTVDAADAYLRGDYELTTRLVKQTRLGRFFGRSFGTLALLEADALARQGRQSSADSLFRLTMTPGAVRDDGETWMALQPAAARGLSSGAVAVGGLEVRRALGGTNERR